MEFHWLIVFTIAAEVDPNCTFIDRLTTLKYPNDILLKKFIKKKNFLIINIIAIGVSLEQICKTRIDEISTNIADLI